jgi:hypothetical protein
MMGVPVIGALYALARLATQVDAACGARSGARTPPRFAILNTLPYHYECIGHVLEYARSRRIPADVFIHGGGAADGTGWAMLYRRLGLLREVCAVESFAGVASHYTHVFCMSQEDVPLVGTGATKVCMLHGLAQAPSGVQWHMYLRPYAQSAAQWVIPAHAMCTAEEKKRALSSTPSVALIGFGWRLPISALREIFSNFDDLEVYIVCRVVAEEMRTMRNVHVYEKATAEEMLAVVMRAHYVAIPLTELYEHHMTSGAIALALGTGTRLVVSATMSEYLPITSPLVVTGGKVPILAAATSRSVDEVYADLHRVCEHRDAIYTAVLSVGIPKIRFCTGPFKKSELPRAFVDILRAEQQLSPDHDIRYFDHDERDNFVYMHFPHLLGYYRNLIPGAFRADLWRLMVLCVHGGIYADLAARFAAPMSTLFRPSDQLVMCVDTPTDKSGICNGLIAARPNSAAIRFAIEHIVRTRLHPRERGEYSLDTAGPKALGRAMSVFFRGADDGAAFVPGDYGTHRILNFENPRVVDERGAVVVWTFKFAGYYDAMYTSRNQKHYYQLWSEGCVFRDSSKPGCEDM